MKIDDNLKDHILESIGEGVFTVNRDFKINFFNKAAERITGYKKEDVIGKYCKHVIKSKNCTDNCPISQVLQSKSNLYDFDSELENSSGKKKPIRLNSAVLYDENDIPTGGIVTFRDTTELVRLKSNLLSHHTFEGIVGKSKKMHEIFDLIKEISDCDAPVFITGESGTGKELVANAIQRLGLRKMNPFIKLNCSVIPEQLLPSELFGHIKGSFTGAVSDRVGRFEAANNGTLFFDEVAEMPLAMQLKLLRVIQEGTFERIGESVTRKVNIRFISATNVDINKALQQKSFREDLFYRLNVIPIELPPLRERKEDILPLVEYFLEKFSKTYKKAVNEIDEHSVDCLMNYEWPGNIRELENVIEYAFVKTKAESRIECSKLPNKVYKKRAQSFSGISNSNGNITEKENLLKVLKESKWNKSKAANILGVGRTTLWRKMKEFNLNE